MVTELLQKYIWLVQTFVRAGERGLSLIEIADRWEDRFDSPYSRRTFNNHREAIYDVFGITIGCNRSTNRYFIEYSDDVSDENAETAWLINTFTVNNMLALGKERLSGRVSVEDIPSGHTFLTSVMDAMTGSHEIVIDYHKYTRAESEQFTLRPYAVKEVAKRWYIVAYCLERKALRVYGLDRVTSLEITDKTFRMPKDFDVDEIFATSFGIYLPDGPGRTIIFRATEKEARFLRDLPIHSSQKELNIREVRALDLESMEGMVYFSIFVCPNTDLTMEFCRRGARVEVISPADVRDAVSKELREAARLYR
ncbi:MAG: WYL domain-containing protein [Bacteroidales bacterium]|nr:WYL domain-containing protein [Bacteroidales bacterium]MBQ8484046.1 WYL domain-containing protein [Bacteroidales bacterium]